MELQQKRIPRRGNRRTTVARLDAVFSFFIRLRGKRRTGGQCELCGKRPIECCFHWVSRSSFATRWDPDNAAASCRGCNFEETFRKQKYRDIFIKRYGAAARETLEAKARTATSITTEELQDMIRRFMQKLKSGGQIANDCPLRKL